MSATSRPWNAKYSLSITGHRMAIPVRIAKFERVEDRDLALRAVNSHDQIVAALETLLADVQDYEAWQRPCHAVDKARVALAAAKGDMP